MAYLIKNNTKSPKRRASAFALHHKAGITVEAAAVAGFFFLAMICMVYIFRMMSLQVQVRNGLRAVGKEMAMEACSHPFFSASRVEEKMVKQIGKERLTDSMIVGGASGLECRNSKQYAGTSIMDLHVSYRIEIPILMFRIPVLKQSEAIRVKGWTGYEGDGFSLSDSEIVYVAMQGIVYHKDRDCTYLETALTASTLDEVKSLRNQNGSKYQACRYCDVGANQVVYVTAYGTRYHGKLSCSRIKRHVYEVPLKEVYGIGGCSKCVK